MQASPWMKRVRERQKIQTEHAILLPPLTEQKKNELHQPWQRALEQQVEKLKGRGYNGPWPVSYRRSSAKTRWGSCSSKERINLHYYYPLLPEEVQTYLLIHEICHLQEMNHGPRFWSLVSFWCPNYQACQKQLRLYQFDSVSLEPFPSA